MPLTGRARPLPPEVVDALRALVAAEEITDALRPVSRGPGHLSSSWVPVTEVRLRLLTGFPVPRLSPGAVAGRREVLAVSGHGGEPSLEVDEQGRPATSAFAVVLLPRDVDWTRARLSSVLEHDVTSLVVQRPPDDRPWPQSMAHRRYRVDAADGSPRPSATGDVTVVEVDGSSVAVQVDRSGAVCVARSISRSSGGPAHRWNVTMLTRGPAVEAVQVVRDAGLLG